LSEPADDVYEDNLVKARIRHIPPYESPFRVGNFFFVGRDYIDWEDTCRVSKEKVIEEHESLKVVFSKRSNLRIISTIKIVFVIIFAVILIFCNENNFDLKFWCSVISGTVISIDLIFRYLYASHLQSNGDFISNLATLKCSD